MTHTVRRTSRLTELLFSDEGQDVIEYALLTALIAVAAIAIWNQLTVTVGQVYTGADTGVQNLSACTPDPDGTGC